MRKSDARPGRALPGAPRRYTEAEASAITANSPQAATGGGDHTMKFTAKQLAAARAADRKEKADKAAAKARGAMTLEQRYANLKSDWAARVVGVEAALEAITDDPEFKSEQTTLWLKDKARCGAALARCTKSVGAYLGKAIELETPSVEAIVRKNLGMTTPTAKAAQAPMAAPTTAEREAARRRVQANLGLLPRS